MQKGELLASNLVGLVAGSDERTDEPLFYIVDPSTRAIVAMCRGEWFNVFRSTSLVHKHIEQTLRSLDELQGVCVDHGYDDIASTVDTIAAGLALGQRVALVGIEALNHDGKPRT